jgi:hypothetical protein
MESLLGLLAFLVFSVFWLSSQDWFDVLPRRITRRVGYAGVVILAVATYFAPTALQSGLQRWTGYAVAEAQEKYRKIVDGVVRSITESGPAPISPSPAPTVTAKP